MVVSVPSTGQRPRSAGRPPGFTSLGVLSFRVYCANKRVPPSAIIKGFMSQMNGGPLEEGAALTPEQVDNLK